MSKKRAQSKTNRLDVSCERPGFAVVLVMCAVVILLVIGGGVLSLGLHTRELAVRTSSEIAARCAADAGLTKIFFEMNEKLKVIPWNGSVLPEAINEVLPNSNATYTYAVAGDLSSGYVIESTGKSGLREKTVSCSLLLKGLFEYAIFGDQDIELKNGAAVDWYNYDADDGNLQVGTNSIIGDSVVLHNGATINGDVVVGAGGDPDAVVSYTWATITGGTYAMTEEKELPRIAVPLWLQSLPSGGTIEEERTISSSAKYDEIDLSNSNIITVDDSVSLYILGDITLKNSAELQVLNADGVCLTLYVGGDIEVKNSGAVNNLTTDPKRVKIYGLNGCENITLKNGSDFYGVIYAPNADVVMMNSADAFGAIISKSFEQKNSATLNYDASLRDVSIDDEGVSFVVTQWLEE